MDVDCGFFGESALLTLACIGAAALLVEGYAFCLGRRLAGRIQVAARLEIQGADREEIKQAQILCAGGGSFGEHSQTAGTGNGGRDRGNADL